MWQQWTNALSSAGDAQCQKGGQNPIVINIFMAKDLFCCGFVINSGFKLIKRTFHLDGKAYGQRGILEIYKAKTI